MKTCPVCNKKHNEKWNVCSIECLNIGLYGSEENAKQTAKKNFNLIGIKTK